MSMHKLDGGESVHCGACLMPRALLTAEHVAAIRDDDMSDEWFESVADLCWQAARAAYVEDLKRRLRAHVAMQLHVVDRRPSRLSLVQTDGGAA